MHPVDKCSAARTPMVFAMAPSRKNSVSGDLVQPVKCSRFVTLSQSRIVEYRVDEILHRTLELHDGLTYVEQLGCSLADDMYAEQLLRLTMKDQFETTGGYRRGSGRARSPDNTPLRPHRERLRR